MLFPSVEAALCHSGISVRLLSAWRTSAVQEDLALLAQFFGEKPDSDSAALFKLLCSFMQLFDTTVVQMMKKMGALDGPEG